MCFSVRPDDLFLDRPAPLDVDGQSGDERAQVDAPVEAVGKGGQRAWAIAFAHCASVPKLRRNSGVDIPCCNWVVLKVMALSRVG